MVLLYTGDKTYEVMVGIGSPSYRTRKVVVSTDTVEYETGVGRATCRLVDVGASSNCSGK